MAGVIHVINMLDAYMTEIAPQGIAEKTQIELGYDPYSTTPTEVLNCAGLTQY